MIILKIHFVNVAFSKCCVTACVLSTVHTMWGTDQWYTDSFVCFWTWKYSNQHITHPVLCKSWKLHCFIHLRCPGSVDRLYFIGVTVEYEIIMFYVYGAGLNHTVNCLVAWWLLPGNCVCGCFPCCRGRQTVCCVYVPVPDELCGAGLGSEWCGCVLALLPLCMLLL